VIVRINDRGPFHHERLIDLSYAAAVKLGFEDRGTTPVMVEAINLAGVDDNRSSPSGSYRYLQIGAFKDLATATTLRDEINRIITYPVTITSVDADGQRLHRVRVGPVANGVQLAQVRDMLMSRGFSPGLALP
ncbi:unnamed protein product, partial [Ectocarpus sp. 12 AP-2014]